jgi:uncharacterized protein
MASKVEDLTVHRMGRQEQNPHAAGRSAKGRVRRAGCPICCAPPTDRFRPFCSRRCADIDLGRWFGESYRIAGDTPGTPSDTDKSEPD